MQEEPRNNGVYPFIGAKLHYHWVGMKKLYYVGRKPSASPAAGSHDQHVREQQDIINKAAKRDGAARVARSFEAGQRCPDRGAADDGGVVGDEGAEPAVNRFYDLKFDPKNKYSIRNLS